MADKPTDKDHPAQRCYSLRHPTTNKKKPAQRCHSEPAPYGWAVRRISQLAGRMRGCADNVCWRSRLRGEILPAVGRRKRMPCGAQDDSVRGDDICVCWRSRLRGEILRPVGLRMTALGGDVICVCWRSRLRGEILPAVGRRKRTPCGAQDDTRGTGRAVYMALIVPRRMSFRAGPIRMGRAKNLPVGGNAAPRARTSPLILCSTFYILHSPPAQPK